MQEYNHTLTSNKDLEIWFSGNCLRSSYRLKQLPKSQISWSLTCSQCNIVIIYGNKSKSMYLWLLQFS